MRGLLQSNIQSLPLVYRGKVRDSYAVGDDKLLIVTTDRLSAFDVVMRQPIPDKGRVLNAMSNFWFNRLGPLVVNHLTGIAPETVVADGEIGQVRDRAVVAWKLRPLPVEAVVRGYLIGSGWKDYQRTGQVCGVDLPKGLKMACKLNAPIFTPASKEALGTHDENISFERMQQTIGNELASRIQSISLALYAAAADTPPPAASSSPTPSLNSASIPMATAVDGRSADCGLFRFWRWISTLREHRRRRSTSSLCATGSRRRTGIRLPPAAGFADDVVAKTADKYREALLRLTGNAVTASH